MVISTAFAAPAARAANWPPRCVLDRHDSATGTSVTFAVCGQGVTALPPRMPAIFAPTKVPMSMVIAIAAFLAAATSAVIELGAGSDSICAQVPAPGALILRSPR
jgi:hypothetical protein